MFIYIAICRLFTSFIIKEISKFHQQKCEMLYSSNSVSRRACAGTRQREQCVSRRSQVWVRSFQGGWVRSSYDARWLESVRPPGQAVLPLQDFGRNARRRAEEGAVRPLGLLEEGLAPRRTGSTKVSCWLMHGWFDAGIPSALSLYPCVYPTMPRRLFRPATRPKDLGRLLVQASWQTTWQTQSCTVSLA